MINTDQLQQIIGSDAYGPDGKIGTVGQIYLDNGTGRPEWATVKTGLFGSNESFVPLAEADLGGDGLRVPYDKDRIKGAPNIAADHELSEQDEDQLYAYYGLASSGGTYTGGTTTTTSQTTTTGTSVGGRRGDRDGDGVYDHVEGRTVGHDTSGVTTDDAMTRSEEHLNVGTQRVEAGRARLRKYIVTEQQQVTVPVTHEQVRVEREPITDANRDKALSGPDLSEEEHEVVLTDERPVVSKETVPVERVRLDKEQVTEQQTVNADVRKEVIETDTDGTTTTGRDRL